MIKILKIAVLLFFYNKLFFANNQTWFNFFPEAFVQNLKKKTELKCTLKYFMIITMIYTGTLIRWLALNYVTHCQSNKHYIRVTRNRIQVFLCSPDSSIALNTQTWDWCWYDIEMRKTNLTLLGCYLVMQILLVIWLVICPGVEISASTPIQRRTKFNISFQK